MIFINFLKIPTSVVGSYIHSKLLFTKRLQRVDLPENAAPNTQIRINFSLSFLDIIILITLNMIIIIYIKLLG